MSTIPNAAKQAQLMRRKILVLLLLVGLVALTLLAFALFKAHGVVIHHTVPAMLGKVIRPFPACGGAVGTPC